MKYLVILAISLVTAFVVWMANEILNAPDNPNQAPFGPKDRFEFKKDRYRLVAVMPDFVLPSGNVRCWILGQRGDFFRDELTPEFAGGVLEPASPEEAEKLKSELRKIGFDPA